MVATSRAKAGYRCSECGCTAAQWLGRCPECQAWGTVGEVGAARPALRQVVAGAVSAPARPIGEIDFSSARARSTGVTELDRVLGGGLVPGSVVLLAGEPGVGKSTLLLEVAARVAEQGEQSALIVSGEESVSQIRLRAERTGALRPRLYLAAETELSAVLTHIDDVRPGLLVVDSVQTISSAAADGAAGGVTQIRAVTAALIAVAKERGIATVLVGHVTKDGAIAGPRLLEHLVDVVLSFDGDKHSTLRLVRAVKNRYGPADEVGCFELTDDGIVGLADPSGLFLTRRGVPVPGTCVTVTVEGRRPLLAEVQALAARSSLPTPRRAVSGVDSGRASMVLAVLERRASIALGQQDVYVATVGGVRVSEPAADLALALAIASSHRDRPIPVGLVAIGEVGLSGELRPVRGVLRRLEEAGRLGFTHALVPADSSPPGSRLQAGMRVMAVGDVTSAIDTALALPRGLAPPGPPAPGGAAPRNPPPGAQPPGRVVHVEDFPRP